MPEKIRSVLYLNPMTDLIEYSRIVLVDNNIPRSDHLFIFLGIFIPFMVGSIWFLKKTSAHVIEKM